MAENSKIEWTTHTFNPWWGCTKVSDGCKFCYADSLATGRFGLKVWGPTADRKPASEATWKEPLKWNKSAEKAGERHRVFCASMADVFEGPDTCQNPEAYKVIEDARVRLFNTIIETPHLDWLLLTKRPENIIPALQQIPVLKRDNLWDSLWADGAWKRNFPNVWLGTSVESQKTAEERIPYLLEIPAEVRFLSCEPLLGPVALDTYYREEGDSCAPCYSVWLDYIHWVIVGGESGPNARPMHPDWARDLRDQCQRHETPFHFKQWGEYVSVSEVEGVGPHFTFPDGATVRRIGKKAAGRTLDGRTWDELPEASQ